MLKLKVIRCLTPNWIANGRVDVIILRGGSQITSKTGYTDSSGYVEFSFDDLKAEDEAQVTVTPSGENPDAEHGYIWVDDGRADGWWDLGTYGSPPCQDSWYDLNNHIIQVSYH